MSEGNSANKKNIIISASADGLGWCMATFLIEQGHTVYLSDINQQKIDEVQRHPLFNKKIFIENVDAGNSDSIEVINKAGTTTGYISSEELSEALTQTN